MIWPSLFRPTSFNAMDIGRSQPLLTFNHTELNRLPLFQVFKAITPDFPIMDENIIPGGAGDKPPTLGCIEPLHNTSLTLGHSCHPQVDNETLAATQHNSGFSNNREQVRQEKNEWPFIFCTQPVPDLSNSQQCRHNFLKLLPIQFFNDLKGLFIGHFRIVRNHQTTCFLVIIEIDD